MSMVRGMEILSMDHHAVYLWQCEIKFANILSKFNNNVRNLCVQTKPKIIKLRICKKKTITHKLVDIILQRLSSQTMETCTCVRAMHNKLNSLFFSLKMEF